MVQLNILSGKMAGTSTVARRFPVRIGRSSGSDVELDEPGVWEQHAELSLNPRSGFCLKTAPNALARVNGDSVQEVPLRNGDTIELGAVRIQFWLSPVAQRRLVLREALSWGMAVAVVLGQLGLLYWLLR